MAVTLSGTTVTFNDATTQSTRALTLGAVQVSGFLDILFAGSASYHVANTSVVITGINVYLIGFSFSTGDYSPDNATTRSRVAYRSLTI